MKGISIEGGVHCTLVSSIDLIFRARIYRISLIYFWYRLPDGIQSLTSGLSRTVMMPHGTLTIFHRHQTLWVCRDFEIHNVADRHRVHLYRRAYITSINWIWMKGRKMYAHCFSEKSCSVETKFIFNFVIKKLICEIISFYRHLWMYVQVLLTYIYAISWYFDIK